MRKLRVLWMRMSHAGRNRREFEAELESHIDMHTTDGVRAGLSAEEARRQALIRVGGAEQARQSYRERAGMPGVESLLEDIDYALRGFVRNPVFTVTVLVTLTIGMGATTGVFSVVDRILFRPLPYAHPEQLVSVGLTAPIIPQEFMLGGSYFVWRDNQKPFSALTSETGVNGCDLTENNPSHLGCATVEANFLPTLGVSPILGRNLLPEEDRPKGPKVALISYALWKGHYGGDPGIVNRLIDIDGAQVRVVGVLPSDFEMPALEDADVVMPQALDEAEQRKADPGRVMYAFARLKPGITIQQAVEQLEPVFQYSLSLAPARFRSEVHLRVRSVRDRQAREAKQAACVLLGAVLVVLLIACANVASLLLTRASARERELAVRVALGASRRRLIRQAFIESLLLSLAGAACGWGLAALLLHIFVAIAPSGLPFLRDSRLDVRMAVFAAAMALGGTVLFGLAPALYKPRSLALASRTQPTGARALLQRMIVAGQIAASLVLLAGAALLVRSYDNLARQPLGMRSQGVVTASITLNRHRYTTPQAQMQFFLEAEAAVRKLPGVGALAVSDSVPPGGFRHDHIYSILAVEGRPPMTGGTEGMVAWRWVTPDYFKALGIPILRGRGFAEEQRTSSEHCMIVSRTLAARLFPGQDPVGQHLKPTPNEPWYTIVGVADDVKNSGLAAEDEPEYYQLRRNNIEDWQQAPSAALIVKTTLLPGAMTQWIRAQIGGIDPTVPVDVETMNEHVSKLADRPRFETALLSFFAMTGLAMALIGLYGVMSYMAAQRTQEIGVRMALGADRGDVLRLILGQGVRLIAVGGTVGLAAALALSQLLQSLLFHVAPRDPATFAMVVVLLATVAVLATLLPARRAASVQPMDALRTE